MKKHKIKFKKFRKIQIFSCLRNIEKSMLNHTSFKSVYLFVIIYFLCFSNRALELAIKHKHQLEEVLNARAKYLQIIDKNETNQSFLTLIANISTSV